MLDKYEWTDEVGDVWCVEVAPNNRAQHKGSAKVVRSGFTTKRYAEQDARLRATCNGIENCHMPTAARKEILRLASLVKDVNP